MKRTNLKKDYEIKKMTQNQINEYLENNKSHKLFKFEDEEKSFMVRENKKSLFIIELIEEIKEKEKQIHISRDRDIKIESRKLDKYGIKLIYHRDSKGEKEYRIYISYKNQDGKLIRKRLRNETIELISRDEKKMIDYYQKITLKEIEKKIS